MGGSDVHTRDAGGVGHFAIQSAAFFGAHVTTTGPTRNVGWLRELGASEVIDYTTTRFEDGVGELDVARQAERFAADQGHAIEIGSALVGPPEEHGTLVRGDLRPEVAAGGERDLFAARQLLEPDAGGAVARRGCPPTPSRAVHCG